MRGLTLPPKRQQRERGAVATLLAVLLAGGVIMGMLAISVDIGNIMYERRQVQNVADATSLALAAECAADESQCLPSEVDDLLNANSHDELSRWGDKYAGASSTGVCARGDASQVGTLLDAVNCADDGDIENLSACPPLPDFLKGEGSAIPYVETYAATQTDSGNELFLPFSKMLVNGPAEDVGVTACARTAWGPPGSTGATLPLTISECDWDKKISENGYAPSPPYTPEGDGGSKPVVPSVIADGGYATGVFTHETSASKCGGSPGHEYPGGFGWLVDSGECEATISTGEIDGTSGANGECSAGEMDKYLGAEVIIPIYSEAVKDSGKWTYEISGVASFYLAGWYGLQSQAPKKTHGIYEEPDGVCTDDKCNTGSVSYIWGWFTSDKMPVGTIAPGAEDFGVITIQPAG